VLRPFRPAALGCALLCATHAWGSNTEEPVALPPSQHLTDGEDRMMSGTLSREAEARSQANALYADAVVALEQPDADPQKALAELRKVVALDPHNEDALLKSANILLQTGQVEAAYEQLQSAANSPRHSNELDALLGYTQHLRGQNDDALRLSTRALKNDPTEATSMRVLLEIAGDQDDLSGAVVHIEDIFKAGGAKVPATAWMTLGRLYVEVARSESHAIPGDLVLKTLLPIYQQAAAKPPQNIDRLTLLSETYQELGDKAEALSTLRRAVDLEPDNVDLILHCAGLEMDLGHEEKALVDYRRAYDLNPNLTGLRELLGQLYLDHGQFQDAVRLLHDALTHSPDDPELEADLGVAYLGADETAPADACFQHAFAAPNCPPEAYLKRAVFELTHHQVTDAGKTLAAAQARFPQSAKIRFYEAIQNRYAKNYDAAVACLDAMRALSPASESDVFNPYYYLESAMIMSLAQKSDRIEPLLEEGLAKYPDNSDLMNELAFCWADRGERLDEALALAQRAEKIDAKNGAIEDTCGWIYFKMGKVNDALPYLQRAAVMTNNDPVVVQHLGDALLKVGRRREALAAWRHGLIVDPSNHDLITRIAAAMAQANHAYSRSAPND
jgi:predicted Zn-dependent protease